jgi:prevent-host-death family protein
MTTQVNMHEAKTQFSKLAEAVEAGEEVIIARAGKPVMKLVKIEQVQEPIVQGFGAEWFIHWDDKTWKGLDKEFNSLFKDAE